MLDDVGFLIGQEDMQLPWTDFVVAAPVAAWLTIMIDVGQPVDLVEFFENIEQLDHHLASSYRHPLLRIRLPPRRHNRNRRHLRLPRCRRSRSHHHPVDQSRRRCLHHSQK